MSKKTPAATLPDIEVAIGYAHDRLHNELDGVLLYHCLDHTFDDVIPATLRFADWLGVNKRDRKLLKVAAAFHDVGWTEQPGKGHELQGVEIARRVLPDMGYAQPDIDSIAGMIMATRLPQQPHTLLEEILADADLDSLGRIDFWRRNRELRAEMAHLGTPMTDVNWYHFQLQFLESHSYFTDAARALRNPQKERNIEEVKRQLALLRREKV